MRSSRRRHIIFREAAIVIVLAVLSSCSGPVEPEGTSQPEPSHTLSPADYLGEFDAEMADRLLAVTNELREENGLQPLGTDDALDEWAKIRAAELIFSFSHDRVDGSDMITAYRGPPYVGYSSAIAVGYRSVEPMLDAWMSLEHQKVNLLSPYFTLAGTACLWHNGTYYCVLVFMLRS
ncbi:MAG: CAP domain-containing protein [Clostridiaceae bacterium]|nr:CAP domain-containing protein [Clostridiaceae bacterium]